VAELEEPRDLAGIGPWPGYLPQLGRGFAWVMIELAPDAIVVADEAGQILLANRQAETLFGHTRDALVGTSVEGLLPGRLRAAHQQHRATFMSAPMTRPMAVGLDLVGLRSDGSEFPVEVSLSPIATEDGTAVMVAVRDMRLHRAHEQAARDAERLSEYERTAADMHDRVISRLFSAGLTLTSVMSRGGVDDDAAQRLHGVIGELDTAIRECVEPSSNQPKNTRWAHRAHPARIETAAHR